MKMLSAAVVLISIVTNIAYANNIATKLNIYSPVDIQMSKKDLLIVDYNLNHTITRAGSVYDLACTTFSADPVVMEYTYQNTYRKTYLPVTFSFYDDPNTQIDTKGQLRMKIIQGGSDARVRCEMF